MIIDSHVHIGKIHGSRFATMSHEQIRDTLLSEMRREGVGHALVLPFFSKKQVSPMETPMMRILQLIKNYSQLRCVGTIDVLNYSNKDIKFLEKLLKDGSVCGVKLYPGYQHFYPTDRRCEVIYALCQKYDAPVIFHSGDTLSMPGRVAKVKYSHPIHIDEVATDHPKLNIIVAHLGNPWMIDTAEALYKNPNVYADISGLVVGESLRTPYGKLMKARIRDLITYSSPRKLLYGTDWPLVPMKPYIAFTKTFDLSPEDKKFVFYKNAARLFKLE